MSLTRNLIALLATGVLLTACATKPVTTATQLEPATKAPAQGVWVGKWKADGDPGEGKMLKVTLMRTAPKVWKAWFDAVCDQDYSFTFDIPGREVGDKIVFDQAVDLGAQNGGVYKWRGEVQGMKFTGEYQSSGYKGGFVLQKQEDKQSSAEYCPNPNAQVAVTKSGMKKFFAFLD